MAAAPTGAAKLTKELLRDLRADIRHLRTVGGAVVQLLGELGARSPSAPGTPPGAKHLAQALEAVEACSARSQLCVRDVAEALAALRRDEQRLVEGAAESQAVLTLRQWVQCPGATSLVRIRSLRFCRQIFETEDYWSGNMAARQERAAREDPQGPNWVVDVVPYDGGYWALNGQRLFALRRADSARARHSYSGLARVRLWPLNNVVQIPYKKDEKDGVLAVFFRLLSRELTLQEQMPEPAGSDSDSDTASSRSRRSRSRSRSRSRPIAEKRPDMNMSQWPVAKRAKVAVAEPQLPIKAEKAEQSSSLGKAFGGELECRVKAEALETPSTRIGICSDEPAHFRSAYVRKSDILRHGPTEACPGCRAVTEARAPQTHSQACRDRILEAKVKEEGVQCGMVVQSAIAGVQCSMVVQSAIAAAKAVIQYCSNREGAPGFYLLHFDMQGASDSLADGKLKSEVQDLVEEMRKSFKSNTACTYRVPARQILKILEEEKAANYDQSSQPAKVKAEAVIAAETASSSIPAVEALPRKATEATVAAEISNRQTHHSEDGTNSQCLKDAINEGRGTVTEATVMDMESTYNTQRRKSAQVGRVTAQEATAPGAGKEDRLPEEVQRVLAASDALANVDSNARGGGGCGLYHTARAPLDAAAKDLEEPLRLVVQDRLEHLRKNFKANTPGSYRSVCKEIREFLVKDVA